MGIEPTPSAWEAEVLPLNYTRCMMSYYARLNLPRLHGENPSAKAGSWQDLRVPNGQEIRTGEITRECGKLPD